ncbi:MAG TPA: hypothetical protein VIK91_22405, partial [Nannocystis sp.]
MTVRIIPGAVGTDRLRALVISDGKERPALAIEALQGGKAALVVREHDADDPLVDQHVRRAGLRMYLCEA